MLITLISHFHDSLTRNMENENCAINLAPSTGLVEENLALGAWPTSSHDNATCLRSAARKTTPTQTVRWLLQFFEEAPSDERRNVDSKLVQLPQLNLQVLLKGVWKPLNGWEVQALGSWSSEHIISWLMTKLNLPVRQALLYIDQIQRKENHNFYANINEGTRPLSF